VDDRRQFGQMILAGSQVREARELLGWTRGRLAGAARVSASIAKAEQDGPRMLGEERDPRGARSRRRRVRGRRRRNAQRRKVTPAQCKADRGLLGWTIQKLAVKSRLISTTVTNFEMGNLPTEASITKMRQALEATGVAFDEDGRVRLQEGKGKP
jgi:ribosome-binding protein aMBF1 (putative translation factor)